MLNETRKSNKIQSKKRNNFCLKQTTPRPPPPCHDAMITSVLPVPYLSVHDTIRFWPIRKECMYDETNYIRYSIITQKNLNGQITREGS